MRPPRVGQNSDLLGLVCQVNKPSLRVSTQTHSEQGKCFYVVSTSGRDIELCLGLALVMIPVSVTWLYYWGMVVARSPNTGHQLAGTHGHMNRHAYELGRQDGQIPSAPSPKAVLPNSPRQEGLVFDGIRQCHRCTETGSFLQILSRSNENSKGA